MAKGRPKKKATPKADEPLESKVVNVKLEEASQKATPTTEVVQVVEENPLKKGDLFLLIVNGRETYVTRPQADNMFQRKSHTVEIPKGSPYTAPKCDGCGQ